MESYISTLPSANNYTQPRTSLEDWILNCRLSENSAVMVKDN